MGWCRRWVFGRRLGWEVAKVGPGMGLGPSYEEEEVKVSSVSRGPGEEARTSLWTITFTGSQL